MNISDAAFRKEDASGLAMRGAIIGISAYDPNTPSGILHPIEWYSRKQRRVVRSTFGAELYAASDSADFSKLIAITITEIGRPYLTARNLAEIEANGNFSIPIEMCVDARSVFDALKVPETRMPSEGTLIYSLLQLKEMLRAWSIKKLWWINTADMLSDGLNKGAVPRSGIMNFIKLGAWILKCNDAIQHEEAVRTPIPMNVEPGPT